MTTISTAPPPVREQVARLTHQRISTWQRSYLADEAKAVAALARLRRGAGRNAGQLPDLWDLVDTSPLHEQPRDARALSEGDLSQAEDAVHVALTLWALHQQARGTGMHQLHQRERPRGLGAAVHRLMSAGEVDEPLRKRLVRAGTAPEVTTLAQRLRDIVVLLRRAEVRLDYALLAGQLYQWQRPGGADTVRTEWGRSFHAWREGDELRQSPSTADADSSTFDTDTTDKDAS
ncbi:type I-E CRISPR-associated protein Cse2/CasB [Streptomyces sp. NPDC056470]|uniref:type I-E CRISPR-associated protein Cse2/CasB n=1 Tax=Streptomyces sp. NPDC056470 TaxID=3345831 RepID=UPI00369D17EC